MGHPSSRVVFQGLTALMLLAVLLFLAACGGGGGDETTETTPASANIEPYPGFENQYPHSFPVPKKVEGKSFTIGCQNPVGPGNETTATFCKGVKAEADGLGMDYIGLDDELSVDTQVSNLNQLLVQGANAAVLYPLAPEALRASLEKAKNQGVPVVGLNVTFTKDAKAPGYVAQVWEGRDHEAYLSVAEMAQLIPKGKVVIIGIGLPVPAIKYLAQRYRYWANKFGLKVIGESDNPSDDVSGGQQAMTGLLGKYGDEIEGVLAYNDESAVGAYTAARAEGRTDIKIVGINGSSLGLNALRSGHVSAIVQVDAVNQGAQAAAAAYDQLTEQGVPLPPVVVRPPRLITEENIDTVSSWSKELEEIESGELSH